MDIAEFFSMQGMVYVGVRNPDGSRQPARWVYDASTLETKQSKSVEEKNESSSGERGLAATMTSKRSMDITLTLGQLCDATAAMALEGAQVAVASGTVTAEAIGTVKAGDVWALNFAKVSDLVLTATPTATLVEDTDYTVNEDLGIVTFLADKTGVSGAYDYAAHSVVTHFGGTNADHYILFAGMNTVDGATGQCRGELYNVTLNAADTFGLIQNGFGELQLTGKAKMDPVRRRDPKWGGYGRLILVGQS